MDGITWPRKWGGAGGPGAERMRKTADGPSVGSLALGLRDQSEILNSWPSGKWNPVDSSLVGHVILRSRVPGQMLRIGFVINKYVYTI